ncbi:MAG: polysaccharide deacetylase family protein [Thermodesulfobacteriota bacterium]|nr:polysaccharide deacetylase family protein [Thermodesulfobacteriota bacterium]
MSHVGLRVDVDTLRGTRIGVPNLVDLLARHHIRASFFFSVGPDNMGRHLWHLMRPTFLIKMLRTRAVSLYGWDIFLRGTLWPGPVIGNRCPGPIRKAAEAGHEIGLHAWDHHRWQMALEKMDQAAIIAEIRKGYELLTDILGHAPECFAAPAWKVTPEALLALEQFPFRFESDCRGRSLFYPLMDNRPSRHVQVPTTLPTYDELVGRQCTAETYNDHLLTMIRPDQLNVLTIHAEVEGIACLELFRDFLLKAQQRDIAFAPLGDILGETGKAEKSRMVRGILAGRDGLLACQDDTDSIEIHDKVSKR